MHRGVGGGLVTENTVASGVAALASGADIIEFDVVRSLDGDFFVFHDGYEFPRFGVTKNMTQMTTTEIEGLRYRLHGDDRHPETVTTVAELLGSLPADALFNVDRSWRFWDTLLPYLDSFDMADRLILKCPPEDKWLRLLAAHEVKYPVIPMVRTVDDVRYTGCYVGANVIGFELLAGDDEHPFTDPRYIGQLQERGFLAFVNAINLENRVPLYAGWDDATSLMGNVAEGWGRLVDLGPDVIQTDWPALLAHYLGRGLNFPVRDVRR